MGGSGNLYCHLAAVTEAAAIRDALEFYTEHGFGNVIIESDAKVIIQMLRKELTHEYNLECTLGDIETLAQSLRSMTFEFYVLREQPCCSFGG